MNSYNSRASRPRQPRDAKARSMINRFTKIDEDIGSRYDYDDDEEVSRPQQLSFGRNLARGRSAQNAFATLVERHLERKSAREVKTTAIGSSRRDWISSISVKDGNSSGKDYILKLLAESVESFHPIAPRVNNNNIEFFITNIEVADSIRLMSRRISDKSNPNTKYAIFVAKTQAPYEQLNFEHKKLIEEVVKKRFSPNSNSIDLSDFGNDKAFADKNIRFFLFNNAVMVVVSNLIGREFSTLTGISLKNNRLRSLDFASSLVYSAPNIVELDLSSNALSRIEELERISGWPIERIHLENNEFTTKYTSASMYTRFT